MTRNKGQITIRDTRPFGATGFLDEPHGPDNKNAP